MQYYILFVLSFTMAAAAVHLYIKLKTIHQMRRNLSRLMCKRLSVDETATIQNEELEGKARVSAEVLLSELINDHRLDELKGLPE